MEDIRVDSKPVPALVCACVCRTDRLYRLCSAPKFSILSDKDSNNGPIRCDSNNRETLPRPETLFFRFIVFASSIGFTEQSHDNTILLSRRLSHNSCSEHYRHHQNRDRQLQREAKPRQPTWTHQSLPFFILPPTDPHHVRHGRYDHHC